MPINKEKQGFELGKQDRKRDDQYRNAVAFIQKEYCSVRFALESGNFPLCVERTLTRYVKNPGQISQNKQHILVLHEREALVKWMEECSTGSKSVDREQISGKIVEILKAREVRNKHSKGLKYEKLSIAAKQCLQNGGPSRKFFQYLFGYYADRISEKKPVAVEKKRLAQYTEETVNEHFFAEGSGLHDTLVRCGIMDPVTKEITDPKRILNRDETPQFVDFNTQKGNNIRKRVAAKGKSAVLPKKENRECVTIDVVMDLSGFLYGAHLMLSREVLTEGLAPDEIEVFDSRIHEQQKLSTYGLVTINESGVQTGTTLLERYKMLDQELSARNVERPVVEMTDNHDSRYDEDVMSFCESKGIVQWSEKANTSGKFQALDQVNRKLHQEIEKAVREFKLVRLMQLKLIRPTVDISDISVGMTDFVRIFCSIWFSWCTPMDRITAFRRVGIFQNALAPDQIDRTNFIYQPEEKTTLQAPPDVANFSGSPEGLRKGSAEYHKRKYEAMRELARKWQKYETSPVEQGILTPDVLPPLPPKPSKGRLSDKNGSFQFNNILSLKRQKKAEHEAHRLQAEFASLQRDLAREHREAHIAEAAAAKAQAAAELSSAFDKCGNGCKCNLFVNMKPVSCWVSKFKKCPICNEIKKSKCAKAECKRQIVARGPE
ncbi:hypothetical protein CYMTET_40890 [Cymbomonas tetramitiformis]|uniref:Uncharacterized protein n=1 Tax=Cymbomonas tetramitiformis TaxID=36881 RepID=A0AAE0F2T5_9CHLO|nr:hypothetical protein CYMTET_40890 [Cymbomonas tetramitiformis]|eukprot:gene8826-10463_t